MGSSLGVISMTLQWHPFIKNTVTGVDVRYLHRINQTRFSRFRRIIECCKGLRLYARYDDK